MFLGLQDLSPDLFFDIDDRKIYIYLSDIQYFPELTNILPMGSFGEDGKIRFLDLDFKTRLKVGEKYLLRDNYAVTKLGETYLRKDILLQEFSTIPKLVEILEKYSDPNENTFRFKVFEEIGTVQALQDLYFIIILYFSSSYREIDEFAMTKQYEILTDVNLELNNFTIITKLSSFFFKAFKEYLGVTPDAIPFACGFGTSIRNAIQSKNTLVQRVQVENEINYFIDEFNKIYGDEVEVQEIQLENEVKHNGGDTWVISIVAKIEEEFIAFKLIQGNG